MADPSRRLRRQGAFLLTAPAEQAFTGTMPRSNLPPPVPAALGKRARDSDGDGDPGSATDIDTEASPTMGATALPCTAARELEALVPSPAASAGRVSATVLQYASTKKLRLEQREEVGVFLEVGRSPFPLLPQLTGKY